MKPITEMTKQEFAELPHKKWNEDVGKFDALVIIPGKSRDLHDSGYRNIIYVFCKNNYPICKSSGGSDVLHINGIGGYGGYKINLDQVLKTRLAPVIDWNIDCLPKSGYLRLFCSYYLTNETDMSSFDVIAHPESRQ
jgi:hypothetical protein